MIDAELRCETGNSLYAYAAEFVTFYHDHGRLKGCEHISGREQFYRQKLAYIQEALKQVEQEAGVGSSFWKDIEGTRAKLEKLVSYITDIFEHAEAASLLKTKNRRALLFQKDQFGA